MREEGDSRRNDLFKDLRADQYGRSPGDRREQGVSRDLTEEKPWVGF